MSYFEDFEASIIFSENKLKETESRFIDKISTAKRVSRASLEDPELLRLSRCGIYLPNKGSVRYIHKMTIEEIQRLMKALENSHSTSKYKGRKEYYLPLLKEELKKRKV